MLHRAIRIGRSGLISRATAALSAAQIAAQSQDTFDRLDALHPKSQLPQTPQWSELDGERFAAGPVAKTLRVLAGTGAGASGLSATILLRLFQAPGSDLALATSNVVDLLCLGRIPPLAREVFYGARLCALVKKDGGVRPIACGEVLRRIAGKLLSDHAVKRDGLRVRYQYAIGVSGGSDAAVQCMRGYCAASRGKRGECALLIDFANAFNSISRQSLLDAVAAKAGHLLPYAVAAYGAHSALTFGAASITSSTGVQQGDPLGPLFFALTLDAAVENCAAQIAQLEHAPLMYLDDVSVIGQSDAVLGFAAAFTQHAADIGLQVNASKTILAGDPDLSGFAQPPPYTRAGWDDVVLLGVPCGSADAARRFVNGRIDAWLAKLRLIAAVGAEDPHVGMTMLRYSGTPSLMHLLRGVGSLGDVWRRADEGLADTLRDILALPALSALPRDQASAPLRLGGLHITRPSAVASSAHACSIASAILAAYASVPRMLRLLREPANSLLIDQGNFANSVVRDLLVPVMQFPDRWQQLADSLQLGSASNAQLLQLHGDPAFIKPEVPAKLQKLCTQRLDHAAYDARIAAAAANNAARDVARLKSLCASGTRLWLYSNVYSSGPKLWLEPPLFRAAVKFRLGLAVGLPNQVCSFCGQPACDVLGDHSLSCIAGGVRTRMHMAIVDDLFHFASGAACNPRREAHVFGDGMRMDMVLTLPGDRERSVLVDVAVTHTLLQHYVRRIAAANDFSPATEYERVKQTHYNGMVAATQVLRPCVFDTFGATSASCDKVLGSIGAAWGACRGIHASFATQIVRHTLSYRVTRESAKLLMANACTVLANRVGPRRNAHDDHDDDSDDGDVDAVDAPPAHQPASATSLNRRYAAVAPSTAHSAATAAASDAAAPQA